MRDLYHQDLTALGESLIEMTQLADGAIARATQALLDADLALAETVIAADRTLDALRADVEKRCYDLLARQQPVATDLRTIVTSLRMVGDLERAGDDAAHVASVARRRHPGSAIPPQLRSTVLEMGQVAQRIVAKAGSVIAGRDVQTALELERDDDEMDQLHRQLFVVVLADDWTDGVEAAIDVTACGRYYERFADHAVSVAGRVIYLVTGTPLDTEAQIPPRTRRGH